jgi:hypothetical protein
MSDDLRNTTAPFSPPTQQAQSVLKASAPKASKKTDQHPAASLDDNSQPSGSRERNAARHHASEDKGADEHDKATPRDLRRVPAERDVYSVSAFCARHSISRDKFYELQREGLAPDTIRIGNRQLVTRESAKRWRAAQERAERERKQTKDRNELGPSRRQTARPFSVSTAAKHEERRCRKPSRTVRRPRT